MVVLNCKNERSYCSVHGQCTYAEIKLIVKKPRFFSSLAFLLLLLLLLP